MPFLFASLIGSSLSAYAQQPDTNSPEAQGHVDRVSFETWIGSLNGDQRRGAEFWVQERSKPKAVSCLATDGSSVPEFVAGCQKAQSRLALPDVRRRTEPDYRNGWNASVSASDAGQPNATPTSATAQLQQKSDQANRQVFSSAIGLPVAQVQSTYSGVDCSGDMCEFRQNHTPKPFCPSAGPCDNLTLFTDGKRVIGYTADFGAQEWTRSLNASISALGKPKTQTIGPSALVKMRNDYWTWPMNGGLQLSYTATSGFNAYGAPLSGHSIMISPVKRK